MVAAKQKTTISRNHCLLGPQDTHEKEYICSEVQNVIDPVLHGPYGVAPEEIGGPKSDRSGDTKYQYAQIAQCIRRCVARLNAV